MFDKRCQESTITTLVTKAIQTVNLNHNFATQHPTFSPLQLIYQTAIVEGR